MLNHCILNRLPLLASSSPPFVASATFKHHFALKKNYRRRKPVLTQAAPIETRVRGHRHMAFLWI